MEKIFTVELTERETDLIRTLVADEQVKKAINREKKEADELHELWKKIYEAKWEVK